MSGDVTQFGIAGATLAILLLIVRFFIAYINKKDDQVTKLIDKHEEESERQRQSHAEQIMQITTKYADTVNNHIQREEKTWNTAMQVLNKMSMVLDKHTELLTDSFNKLFDGINKIEMKERRKSKNGPNFGRRISDIKQLK